jgi:hypothetical protein
VGETGKKISETRERQGKRAPKRSYVIETKKGLLTGFDA